MLNENPYKTHKATFFKKLTMSMLFARCTHTWHDVNAAMLCGTGVITGGLRMSFMWSACDVDPF